ncbi:hypothetical protein BJX70DRAFT_165051 [Aspergillus crustosus]
MSADLLAEFGYGAGKQPSTSSHQQPVTSPRSLIADLDALEDATPTTQSSLGLSNQRTLRLTQLRESHGQSEHLDDFGDFERPRSSGHDDVLFDATLEEFSDAGSDDWGEFESAEAVPGRTLTRLESHLQKQHTPKRQSTKALLSPKLHQNTSAALNLLDSLDSFSFEDKPQVNYTHRTSRVIDNAPAKQSAKLQSEKPKLSVDEEPFEEWEDFTDGPLVTSRSPSSNNNNQKTSSPKPPKTAASPRETPQISRVAQSPPAGHIRPTNIPPPSILLELFPQLFERLRQEGTEAKRNLQRTEALKSVALSIIYTLKAAARVVAGRTLRWKRDAILSQSIRIGPARSGKAGGMKLSTVNKNEDIKEKQEAVDVIQMWRDRAALFNSVIQAAGKRPIQSILESTRVTTATASQGALKASHACALCGLKRDERVPRIDENVNDSFGEWWTDHWGHAECRQFWEDNTDLLGQR